MKRFFWFGILFCLLFVPPYTTPQLHAQNSIVTLSISAGFAGRFRDNMWTPVTATLENTGPSTFSGILQIRPERSRGLLNPISTPIDLAPNTRQTITIYVSLRSFSDILRAELLTTDGLIASESEARVSAVLPRERLYARISDSFSAAIDLNNAAAGGQLIAQADIPLSQLPDRAIGLQALDAILIYNADTSALTGEQRTALQDWVTAGGHLIVTGGINGQLTAAGLIELLPLRPTGSTSSTDWQALGTIAGTSGPSSSASTLTTGTLSPDAIVLAATSQQEPLIARRQIGAGLVDFLAFDPLSVPFNTWPALNQVWLTLLTSTAPRTSWAAGFVNIAPAYTALEILPGIDILPEAAAMVVFLLVYILTIGPLNYILLSRIKRRELAWLTIPLLIIGFTIFTWQTGFSLRGEQVILSRLTFVESWNDAPQARIRQIIGLLAPRRAQYNLSPTDDRALRPLLRTGSNLTTTSTTALPIIQDSNGFRAANFPVDASFMAGFITEGQHPKPTLSGQITIQETAEGEIWRGSIQHNLDTPLHGALLVGQNGVLTFDHPLNPGQIYLVNTTHTFDIGQSFTPASPIQYATGFAIPTQSRYIVAGRSQNIGSDSTASQILGTGFERAIYYGFAGLYRGSTLSQDDIRRHIFLSTFMIDQFSVNGLGESLYLIGWTDTAPTREIVSSTDWRTIDTTLYALQLDTQYLPANPNRTTIRPHQFTWLTLSDESGSDLTPNYIVSAGMNTLNFRFTPIPSQQRLQVSELYLHTRQTNIAFANTQVSLYDWQRQTYTPITLNGTRTRIPNPRRFIGPLNAVQVQIQRTSTTGSLSIASIAIEQVGSPQP